MKKVLLTTSLVLGIALNVLSQTGVTANFVLSYPVDNCAPQSATFKDSSVSQNSADSIITWLWYFGDERSGQANTSTFKNPVHTYKTNGKFDVSLVVKTALGEKDSITKEEIVSIDGPQPKFILLGSNTNCINNAEFYIKDLSVGVTKWEYHIGDYDWVTFFWRPFDSIFLLEYPNPGIFYLSLKGIDTFWNPITMMWDICSALYGDTSNKNDPHFTIEVYPMNSASFIGDTLIYNGTEATFTDLSDTAFDSIQWDFGDGSNRVTTAPGATVKHTYILQAGQKEKTYDVNIYPYGARCPETPSSHEIKVIDTSVSVNMKILEKGVNIYPNPAYREFIIDIRLLAESNVVITIFNAVGEVIKVFGPESLINKQYKVDVSRFKKGFYFVNIRTQDERATIPIEIIK